MVHSSLDVVVTVTIGKRDTEVSIVDSGMRLRLISSEIHLAFY